MSETEKLSTIQMKDKIYIKGINKELTWNQPLAKLLPFVSYRCNLTTNEIDINLSGQWLTDEIRMDRGELGKFPFNKLNSIFFTEFSFYSTTDEVKLVEFAKKSSSSNLEFINKGTTVDVKYKGQNQKKESRIELISDKILNFNPLNKDDWAQNESELRAVSNYETHEYHFDYNHNISINFNWFHFSNLDVFGLSDLSWFGYYKPQKRKLYCIESRIGDSEESFEKIKKYIVQTLGNPNAVSEPKFNDNKTHKIRKEIWELDNIQILIYSTIIPRVDTWTYEIKIINKNSG